MRRSALALLPLAALVLGWAGTAAAQQPPNPRTPETVAAVARALQARLPIELVDGVRVVAIRAEGSELVNEVSIATTLFNVENVRAELQPVDQRRVCEDTGPTGRILIQLGATIRHSYTDAAGNRFETRVTSCP